MVLEEASSSPPSSDFTSESTPSSDLDPYASSNDEYHESRPSNYIRVTDSSPPIYVNTANLPTPFLGLYNKSTYIPRLEKLMRALMRGTEQQIQRPVTQEEADALAFHYAKTIRISSYGTPIGLSIGMLQFLRTWRRFRFPGWTPFKEGSRLSPDRFGPLRGAGARGAWHFARGNAYAFGGVFIGDILYGIYGATSTMAARMSDPRLKDLLETARRSSRERLDQSSGAASEQRQLREQANQAEQRGESVEMWRMRKRAEMDQARKRQAGRVSSGGAQDDMSPTGGAFEEETKMQSDAAFFKDDWQAPRESGMDRQSWQDNAPASGETSRPASTAAPHRTSSSSTQRPSSPTKQSSSAWDRLRQDALSNPKSAPSSSSRGARSSSTASSQSNASAGGADSFSFSSGEEDKQLARSEAQKDFDARLEKEREGRDFDDGSGRGKKW